MTAPSCPECGCVARQTPLGYVCDTCHAHVPKPKAALDGDRPQGRATAKLPDAPAFEVEIDLANLLDEVVVLIRRYIILADEQAHALALWTAHTHALEAAEATPYVSVNSPEKRSGKTRLLEVEKLLVARPWFTGRVTAAVLVRKLAKEKPTLLLDESDAAFRAEKEYAAALQAILNAGYRRGGCASLCVKAGADFDLRDFPVFGPKAIAGIGKLPDTVADRAIPITLKRRAPNEPVARFRQRDAEGEARPIRDALVPWAAANTDALADARPDLPPELDDRAADVWEPLLAIADLAGGDWPKRARAAALMLSVGEGKADDSLGVRLLADIRAVFEEKKLEKVSTGALIAALLALDEAPWGDLYDKPLDARGLARRLRPYGLKSHTIRLPDGKTPKGYEATDFHDAWQRYCMPEKSATSATSATTGEPKYNSGAENVADVADVADSSGIQAEGDDNGDGHEEEGGADDTVPSRFTGQRHYLVALGLELGFPRLVWPSDGTERPVDGIPGDRFHYEQAARYFPDADIERAVAALEVMA